jgi:NAD(P)H dehydrogenase (quinone)
MRAKKKILVFLGQEDKETFCGDLADHYEKGAREAGAEVKRINIGDLKFDPLLHKGYKEIQALEPDLAMVQEAIKWCDHFVLIYPMWWSAMPAILKGMIDRMFLPGFAYHFFHNGMGWTKLLKGRSADVFITMDSWPMVQRFLFGDSTNEISRAILGFAGIHPVKVKKIGPVKTMSDAKKESWKEEMRYRATKEAR